MYGINPDCARQLSILALLFVAGCADSAPEASDAPAPLSAAGGVTSSAGSGTPPPQANGTDTLPSDTSSEEEPPSSTEWTAGIVEKENEVTGAPILAEARIARNQGFDRVVLEFDEDEIPSYRIEYVDSPIAQCGSGNPVQLRGGAWLLVRLEPARAHNEEGRPTIEEREGDPNLPVLLQHRIVCDFEGHVEWVFAVSTPNRFRVMELAEPARLVVDIRH